MGAGLSGLQKKKNTLVIQEDVQAQSLVLILEIRYEKEPHNLYNLQTNESNGKWSAF